MEKLKNVKVVFGLEAQGHLPTIEAEIARYDQFLEPGEERHMQYSYSVWEDIGKKIGWQPLAAALSYFEYLSKKDANKQRFN